MVAMRLATSTGSKYAVEGSEWPATPVRFVMGFKPAAMLLLSHHAPVTCWPFLDILVYSSSLAHEPSPPILGPCGYTRLFWMKHSLSCNTMPKLRAFALMIALCVTAGAPQRSSEDTAVQPNAAADLGGSYGVPRPQQGYDYVVETIDGTKTVPSHMTTWVHSLMPTRTLLQAADSAQHLVHKALAMRHARSADSIHSKRRRRNRRRSLLASLRAAADALNPMANSTASTTSALESQRQTTQAAAGHTFSVLDKLLGLGSAQQQLGSETETSYTVDMASTEADMANWDPQGHLMFDISLQDNILAYMDAANHTHWQALYNATIAGNITEAVGLLTSNRPRRPPNFREPRPPCTNGLVQQDDRCVCPPGFAPNLDFNGCVRCPIGWVSIGGPVTEARCRPCPELTTSNPERVACVINIGQPDPNAALCQTCFDPAQPFSPPACCPKGQICCGALGCCGFDNCINNATTNNQPFCCESASAPCPLATTRSFGLNCCIKGTTCLNTSSTAQTCCPIEGVCLGSTVANNRCCIQPLFCAGVDRTGVAQCCQGPFCPNAGANGNGVCCTVGQSCIDNRLCCNSANAQICRNPNATDLAETCCGVDTGSACISSPLNPGLRLCCPTAQASFVCGNSCCNRANQQCLAGSQCCDNNRVCPSTLNPKVEICCPAGQICNTTTRRCSTA